MSDVPGWHPERSEGKPQYYGLTPEEQAALDAETEVDEQALAEHVRPFYENLDPNARRRLLHKVEEVSRRFAEEELEDFDANFEREIPDVLGEGEE